MAFKADDFLYGVSKRYACGAKRRAASPRALSSAFMRTAAFKNGEDKAFFEKLLKTVESAAEGRKTLREFSKTGCSVRFEEGANVGGFFSVRDNAVVINPAGGFKDFSSVFIHEARHAVQYNRLNDDLDLYRFADGEKLFRAFEADATAHECAFIHQMRDKRPDIYEEHAYSPMLQAYSETLDKTGNEKQAMQASFKAWYSYDYYRDYYDASVLNRFSALIDYAVKYADASLFSKKMPEDVTDRMCLFNGKPYVDKAFLESPAAFSIPERNQKKIGALLGEYAQKVDGAPYDSSVFEMYPRRSDGVILPKKTAVRAAYAATAKKGRGR